MLFSGGSTGQKGTPPKESKKERKPDRDEKYEIQEAVFLRWANHIVEDEVLQELRELADLKFLSKFSTLILGVPVALGGKNDADDIDAIFHAMVPDEPEHKLFQISVNELLSGQQKPQLAMCWQLVQIYWAKFAPPPSNRHKMTEALKEWCLEATSAHPDILINDFTSSFRDGMAINILIKSFDDSLVDLQEISELRGEDRIENALSLASRHFRVPKLIHQKEFYKEHLDMKSVACYLMMLYLGMCKSSSCPKLSTRRRSTAPANVGSGSLPGAQPSGQKAQQQPRHQSQPQSPTSPTARHASLGQVGGLTLIAVPSQQQQPTQPTPVSATPPVPATTTTALPTIVQANMLAPPPTPQSPKAYVPLFQQSGGGGHTAATVVVSPLAQQSHNQVQLLHHQQQQHVAQAVVAQPQLQQQVQRQQSIQLEVVQTPPIAQQPPAQIVQQQVPVSPVSQPAQLLLVQAQPQQQQPQTIQILGQQPQPTQMQVQLVQAVQRQNSLPAPQQPLPQAMPTQVLVSQEQLAQLQAAAAAQLPPIAIPPSHPTSVPTSDPKTADFQQPLSPKSLAQFQLPQHTNDGSGEGMRSRKSSSCSSQSRGRRRKPEEMVQEYANCLQQVLSWLTEAEQELAAMGDVEAGVVGGIGALESAKEKFREHEQYMQSLTQSQENIGRVLHRGHQLSQRVEGEQSTAIISQLQVVSGRWEKIRERALERQSALQNQIDRIQREHLGELMAWLNKAEWREKEMGPLAENLGACQRQLVELAELQRTMKEKQPAIQRLSTFVAVVDSGQTTVVKEQQQQKSGAGAETAEGAVTEEPAFVQLETLVKQVDKRWSKLGEQLEQRSKLLDGLGDLLEQYDKSTGQLSKWLATRSEELQSLRPAKELSTGEQVQEQLDLLRAMERALETQQEAFVRLSRICTELASKFERGKNLVASERVHEKLDSITRTWDQIVTRLEEHSETLIHSGKVKLATDIQQQLELETGKSDGSDTEEQQPLTLAPPPAATAARRNVLETIYSVDEGPPESPQSPRKRKLLQAAPSQQQLAEEEEGQEPAKRDHLRLLDEQGREQGKDGRGNEEVYEYRMEQLPPLPVVEVSAFPMETDEPGGKKDQTKEKKTDEAKEESSGARPSSSSGGELSPPAGQPPAEPQQLVNQFVQKVTSMDRKIQPLVDWAQQAEAQAANPKLSVRQQVLQCQKRLNEVRELEPAVTKLQIQLEFMHNRTKLNQKQLHNVNEIFDVFMSHWSRVVATISKVLSLLSKPEPLLKSPSKTPPEYRQQQPQQPQGSRIMPMVEQLVGWLNASDNYLDQLPVEMAPAERLKKIAQIAKQLSEQQAQLSHVKRLAKLSPTEEKAMQQLDGQMVALLRRIDKMRRETEEQQQQQPMRRGSQLEPPKSPRTTTVQLKKDDSSLESESEGTKFPWTKLEDKSSPPPLNEAESLRLKLLAEEAEIARASTSADATGEGGWPRWLQEKQGQLRLGGECVPGDLKLLSAELERCDQMIAELRSRLRAASSSESDVEMVAPIELLLRAAETKRNHCVDSINKTQLAIHKAVKVEEVGDKFKRELDWLRRNLADSPLREAEQRLKHLKSSLHEQAATTKAEAVQLLEEVAQMAQSSGAGTNDGAADQMRKRVAKLQYQWKQLEEEIEDLLGCCARECQRRAEGWLRAKQTLLEELEQALKASFESATDAEELSEHLDNLERLLDRLGSIEREAEEEGYQQELTAFDPRIVELKQQNEALGRATQERCQQLRNAVTRCEHFEQRLCQMQHWCTNMHQVLNQRIASDTFALDVPQEYKEAQRSGTLFKRMDKEFADYDQLVAELDDYIAQSRSDFASTERLKLQRDHANQQLDQLRNKFREFKQPIGLFERMDRIQKQLAEHENSIDDLTGIQAENCEFCLLHVEQLQRQLEELGTECAACEAGRDTLIREGILEEAQALKITARLTELTAKCVEELEPRARHNVQRLKRASELLQKLERENAVLDKLLGEVENRLESELDQTLMEGKPTQRSVKALDELSRQLRASTDAAAKARELESLLRQLSIRLSPETLASIAKSEQRCSKLKDRLTQWSEKIQELAESSQTGGESETDEAERSMNKVAELATELERRIGQLEQMAASLNADQLNEQLNELRPLKERYEKRALQLLGKTDFSRRVAPSLADLTSRWQRLTQKREDLRKAEQEQQRRREAEAKEQQEKAAERRARDLKRQQRPAVEAEEMAAEEEEEEDYGFAAGNQQPTIDQQQRGGGSSSALSSLIEPLAARVETEPLGEISEFGQRVQSMIDQFEKAKRHLNYAKHPLRGLEDWEKRLKEIGLYVANRKLSFDQLIAEGKQVAEVGPMELITSAALAKLDELIELVHELDEQIEREETRVHKVRRQFAKLDDQVQLTGERLAAMEQRASGLNLRAIDPTPIITLQQELMDTSGQLQLLQLSADELRKSLPPAMHEQRIGGDVLDRLNRQLHEIEARVQTALLHALQAQQEEEVDVEEEEEDAQMEEEDLVQQQQHQQMEEEQQQQGEQELLQFYDFPPPATLHSPTAAAAAAAATMPQGHSEDEWASAAADIGSSSGGPPLLAMDAYGTEDEAKPRRGQPQQRKQQEKDEKMRKKQKGSTTADKKDQAEEETETEEEEELLLSTMTPMLPTPFPTAASTASREGRPALEGELLLLLTADDPASMEQFYVNLSTMEEYMEQQHAQGRAEALPFEGLDQKEDILEDFETELQRGEQLVAERQMTMEVGESEHIQDRIGGLRHQIARRKGELAKRREAIRTLEQHFSQCGQMLDELAHSCKTPRHSPGGRPRSRQQQQKKEETQMPAAAAASSRNGSPDLDELETAQARLESQLPPIAVRLQQIQNRLNGIAEQLSSQARDRFQQRIRLLVDDFNECTKAVRTKRKALEERFADQTQLNQQLEELEFWCDETEAILDSGDHVGGPLNPPQLAQHVERVRQRHSSADAKLDSYRHLERLKDRFVGLASVEPQAKHEVRRSVAQLGERISDVRMKLKEKMDALQEEQLSADELWREFSAMQQWVEMAQHQIQAVETAKIYKPSLVNIEKLASQVGENRFALHSIQRRLLAEEQQRQQMNGGGGGSMTIGPAEKENLMRVDDLLRAFERVAADVERLLEQRAAASEESSSLEEEIEQLYSQMDMTKEKLLLANAAQQQQQNDHGEQQQPGSPRQNGHGRMRGNEPESMDQHQQQNGHENGNGHGLIEYGTLSTHSGELTRELSPRHQIEDEGPLMLIMPNGGAGGEDEEMAMNSNRPRRRMSLGEQARLDTVTRLRSWLQEIERDASATVDLSDQHLVRQALGKMQNCVDDIQIHELEIIRVLDDARDRLIVERAQLCASEMERVLGVCKRRKGELQKILEQCRIWEQLRGSVELWLNDANDRLASGGRVMELSDPELAEQLQLCDQLGAELDIWKEKLQEMNRLSNQLLDIYRRDDGHNLSHLSSKLNTQWTKFNDQLRIRRAVLEAAQRSRHDFQTALGHFQHWLAKQSAELQKLEKETNNPQRVKDTGRRREWLAQEKEARLEMDAHRDMMESVKRMGRKLLEEQHREMSAGGGGGEELGSAASKAREQLRKQVEAVESEWQALLELGKIVRHRLESAQEECERLTQSLSEFLFWTDQQRKTLANTKPVGGDLSAVQKQCDIARTIQRGVEARERPVEECIQLAFEFLMQHNLRPPLHHPSLMAEPPTDPYSPKTEAEREERRVGQQINSDARQLQTQWTGLKEELAAWLQQVGDAHKEMQELDRAVAEALLATGKAEEELHALKPVEDLLLEELKDAKAESTEFRQRVHEAGTHVDDVNNWASSIQATGIQLSDQLDAQVRAVNERFDRLKRELGCRWVALERAFNDFGPASEHFLVDLVEPPWQRAISSTNRLPYYIDHSTERTQWDHPAMVDILEGLCSFNQVKFSAYRTAMKLRALQKRLCLDLIDLAHLNVQYEKQLANYTDEQRIQVEDVIQCLLPLFEKAHEERPALVPNVSLAVDLTLNLLLNIYDPCRDAKMRVLSFKVALVVLCHATLESKYTYLFHLISTKEGVDHKRLAVLFYDLIHIPKFLGEAAAFGGSNIEPSVRSCFEQAKFAPHIGVDQFLEWLKKEPQSLVWLPVMHRLASSEFAKHQAKCNACKMFPIVGLRYRCLRCFNFDICQNCFFSQRIAKSHKLNHPMQEYCTPTSTGDDVRDFTAVIKNKVRQGRGKIGYLPVEQINEGPPLERTDQTPQNADTESMHQRAQLIAYHLDKCQTEAAEHFPSAIILPSESKMDATGHITRNVTIGTLPAPIIMGNGTESEENGSSSSNGGGEHTAEPRTASQQSTRASRAAALAARLQSPEIKIYHNNDFQRNAAQAQMLAAAAALQEAKSPSQLVSQVDQNCKEELGQLLQKLQLENIELKRKVEERQRAARAGVSYQQGQGAKSTPNLHSRTPVLGNRQASDTTMTVNGQPAADPHQARASSITAGQTPTYSQQQQQQPTIFSPHQPAMLPPPVPRHYTLAGRSIPASLHRQLSLGSPVYQALPSLGTLPPPLAQYAQTTGSIFEQQAANDQEQAAVLAEAHQLRQHQKRLEERGLVLEDQNRQLQQQLERLQKLMEKKGETPAPLQPGTPRRLHQSAGVISSTEAEDTDMEMLGLRASDIRAATGLSTGQIGTEIRRNRMDRLRETVDELNRAMENFVLFTQNCAANGVARREHPDTDQDSGTADQEEGQLTTADEQEAQ